MPQIKANGLSLEYAMHGPEGGEPMLLVMGLGAQMTRWSGKFLDALAAGGYRIVTYDNRDVGLSERFDAAGAPDLAAIYGALAAGQRPDVPYFLSDMAADGAALLEALNMPRAHVVGASMGGMIAQMMAADHAAQVLSLTSIMSSTGNPALPRAKPEAAALLTTRAPDPSVDLEGHINHGVAGARITGSPGYPAPEAELRERIRSDALRAYYPVGVARQMAAVVASGDRRGALARITAPTVVIHGADDALVPVEGGHDTAATIPHAELHVIPGMGHDVPNELVPQIVELIGRAAARARTTV